MAQHTVTEYYCCIPDADGGLCPEPAGGDRHAPLPHLPQLRAPGVRDPRPLQTRGGELRRQGGAEEEDHVSAG